MEYPIIGATFGLDFWRCITHLTHSRPGWVSTLNGETATCCQQERKTSKTSWCVQSSRGQTHGHGVLMKHGQGCPVINGTKCLIDQAGQKSCLISILAHRSVFMCLQVIVSGMSSSAAVDGEGLAYKSADYQGGMLPSLRRVQIMLSAIGAHAARYRRGNHNWNISSALHCDLLNQCLRPKWDTYYRSL